MILPDVNLLLYAYDASSPFHHKAVSWLNAVFQGTESIGFCAPVLFAFVCLATNTRVFVHPLTVEEVAAHVTEWLDQPNARFVETQQVDIEQALALLRVAGTAGNLTTDAQIAAVALRVRAVVYTTDGDYARFANLSWHNPLND